MDVEIAEAELTRRAQNCRGKPLTDEEHRDQDEFLEFAKVLRSDMAARFSPRDHQKAILLHLWGAMLGYLAVILGVVGGLRLGVPQPLLYGAAFVGCFYSHRWGMSAVHGRVHTPRGSGSPLAQWLMDVVVPVLTFWSPEAFRPRHREGHVEDIGVYAAVFGMGEARYLEETLGFFANPLAGLMVLLRGGMDRRNRKQVRLLTLQVLLITAWFVVGVAEVYYHHTAFILVCHLLSAVWGLGAAILVASMVHSSTSRPNSFKSCAILRAEDADPMLSISLTIADDLIVGGIGMGHALHHADPNASTAILQKETEHWRDYIREHYPHVRYNRTLIHDIYPKTLASLAPPGWLDKLCQVGAACLALVVSGVYLLRLAPSTVMFLAEHLMVDYRLVLRLLTWDRQALGELRDWLRNSPFFSPDQALLNTSMARLKRGFIRLDTWLGHD